MAQIVLATPYLLKSHLFDIWHSRPSSSVAWLPVDEPALAQIMTHDHDKEQKLYCLRSVLKKVNNYV